MKGKSLPVAVVGAGPVAAGAPRPKAGMVGAGVGAVVLVPGGLNALAPGWVLAVDDVEVSPGLAARPGNRLEVLPIIWH